MHKLRIWYVVCPVAWVQSMAQELPHAVVWKKKKKREKVLQRRVESKAIKSLKTLPYDYNPDVSFTVVK